MTDDAALLSLREHRADSLLEHGEAEAAEIEYTAAFA